MDHFSSLTRAEKMVVLALERNDCSWGKYPSARKKEHSAGSPITPESDDSDDDVDNVDFTNMSYVTNNDQSNYVDVSVSSFTHAGTMVTDHHLLPAMNIGNMILSSVDCDQHIFNAENQLELPNLSISPLPVDNDEPIPQSTSNCPTLPLHGDDPIFDASPMADTNEILRGIPPSACLNIPAEFDDTENLDVAVRKRKRKPDPLTWSRNIQKKKRACGVAYDGVKYDRATTKWHYKVKRPERTLGTLCTKQSCHNSKTIHCNSFSQEDCHRIFTQFWSSGDRTVQNTFLKSSVENVEKHRSTTLNNTSKRLYTRVYKLKKDGITLKVCKEMFLATLGISSQRVNVALASDPSNVGISAEVTKRRNPRPSRGFSWSDEDQEALAGFFRDIPKAPGHYCRKDSKKIYLCKIVPTMQKLYMIYQKRCEAMQHTPFSYAKFSTYFHDNNFSLFKRKKDMCNKCIGYEEGTVDENYFKEHQKRKNEGYACKDRDKQMACDELFVYTCDTESLLIAPHNNADIMFFRTKLNLHNFTCYDLRTKDTMNYVWSEVNGGLDSSNFISLYIDYLTSTVEKNCMCTKIIIWSDGCTYQNRCKELASALLTFASKHQITIEHKYLEVGHTHLECDSVHSTIERAIKTAQKVNLPTDYIPIIAGARKAKPYGVKYLTFDFFKNYRDTCNIKSIKPSKEVGPPFVVDVRQYRYNPDSTIDFNLTYNADEWKKLPYDFTLLHSEPPTMYLAPLKVSYEKYKHLQEIKETISPDCHWFYDQLDHHPNKAEKVLSTSLA